MRLAVKLPYLKSIVTPIAALLIGMFHYNCSAQSSLKGRIQDTILRKGCPMAVIALLKDDSCMIQFTRSRKDGSFILQGIEAGRYQLMITHPQYSSNRLKIELSKDTEIDLGVVAILPQAEELASVTVTPKDLPMHINGDTLEFNTSHLKMRTNATVEELLTRLPGVQVDENGVITVNGKKIDKLLVDGEDLFGRNPSIITRNFNADLIAKIQVLDKKSRQAEFTGIDDGKRTQTINLTLKGEEKRGYFLKAEVGESPQRYHTLSGLLGSFKDRRQLAVLGMAANTGVSGFSGNEGNMGSDLSIANDASDPLGASAGRGIPQTTGAGVHYSNHWNAMDDHLSVNYSYGNILTKPYSTMVTRQTLADSVYIQRQQSSSINTTYQHALAGEYDYIPDSVSAFHFSLGGGSADGRNALSSADSSSFNDTLINTSLRRVLSDIKNHSLWGEVMWRRQGRKEKERVFSVIGRTAIYDNNTNGFLYSLNSFYQSNGSLLGTDTVDQRRLISGNGVSLMGNISYTEILWRRFILGIGYGTTFERSHSLLSTYNKIDGKYEEYVDSLSSYYENKSITQSLSVNVQRQYKKVDYALGVNIGYYFNNQSDLLKTAHLQYRYLTIGPHLDIGYNLDDYRHLKFSYGGNTEHPSIQQLQPIQYNNDPLHIKVGNPTLRIGFTHGFTVSYNEVKSSMKYFNLAYRISSNVITNKTITDSLGRQISQAVNAGSSQNISYNAGLDKMIKPLDLNMGVSNDLIYSRNLNFVNQYLNKNDNYFAGAGIRLDRYVTDKYKFILGFHWNYAFLRSSINPSGSSHYWTQNHNAELSIYPSASWELGMNASYFWRQRLGNVGRQTSMLVWNAYINKNCFNNQLVIKWQINDILNRNIGSSRVISTNQVTESTFNIIGRYWMISASWRFKHQRKIENKGK